MTACNPDVAFAAEGPLPSTFGGIEDGARQQRHASRSRPTSTAARPSPSRPGSLDGLPDRPPGRRPPLHRAAAARAGPRHGAHPPVAARGTGRTLLTPIYLRKLSTSFRSERVYHDATTNQRALAAGLVMAVTLNAFEAVAVVTAMPAISEELDGDRLYGAAFSAYMLASLVALVVSGEQADRRGPAVPFLSGVGDLRRPAWWSPASPRRWASCWPDGCCRARAPAPWPAWPTSGIGRAWSTEQQPRLFALLSTAWVVPSLVAPLAAGWITEQVGWRWVFLGLLPLVPVLLLLAARPLMPSARRPRPSDGCHPGSKRRWRIDARGPLALRRAAGHRERARARRPPVGLARWLPPPSWSPASALAGPALLRLLPDGTLHARARHPRRRRRQVVREHRLLRLRHLRPSRRHSAPRRLDPRRRLGDHRRLTGLDGGRQPLRPRRAGPQPARRGWASSPWPPGRRAPILVTVAAIPLWVTFLTCALSGFGIGVVFNTTSVSAMGQAPKGREGLVGSQLGVADALGFATIGAIGGGLVGAADRGVARPRAGPRARVPAGVGHRPPRRRRSRPGSGPPPPEAVAGCPAMPGPLQGVRVLDLSVMISGPLATMILADQGAEVIKVESPGLGDIMRFLGTSQGGMTGIFANNNRGKRSLVLDLKQPAGVDVLHPSRGRQRRVHPELPARGDGTARPRLRGAGRRQPSPRLRLDLGLRPDGTQQPPPRLRQRHPGRVGHRRRSRPTPPPACPRSCARWCATRSRPGPRRRPSRPRCSHASGDRPRASRSRSP